LAHTQSVAFISQLGSKSAFASHALQKSSFARREQIPENTGDRRESKLIKEKHFLLEAKIDRN
jgi:hypothetical protein